MVLEPVEATKVSQDLWINDSYCKCTGLKNLLPLIRGITLAYFACWFSRMALMHFPRVKRELLMFPASFSRSPVFWVREQRSDPARSQRASLAIHWHVSNCKYCFELSLVTGWSYSLMPRTLGTPMSSTLMIRMEKMLWLQNHKHADESQWRLTNAKKQQLQAVTYFLQH